MTALARLAAITASRGSRWAVIGLWLVLAVAFAPLQGPLQEEAADESETFQVRGSESLAAKHLIDARFRRGSEMAAVIAYRRDSGIESRDRERILADARAICRSAKLPSLNLVGTPYGLGCGTDDPLDLSPGPGLLLSSDNTVVLASALMTDDSTQTAESAVAAIRDIVPPPEGDASGLRAYVTGEAGFEADRSAAVKGIDETLLLVTCAVLVLLLLAIYRSPLVAVVPIFVVGVAYVVAGGLTYMLVAAGVTEVSGQTTAILIVLMFGAGTDYCLLIVARFRDELRRTEDVGEAMVRATERTGPAILSAGAIVVVAMLVLTVADFNATREMGPILALGIVVMVVAGLTLLPAILATLGRRSFWPSIPRVEPEAEPVGTLWRRVGHLVASRPAAHRRGRDRDPGRRRARLRRRARAAAVLGGVPRGTGLRARRAAHQRPLHPRPGGAAEHRGRRRVRGAGHDRAHHRARHAHPGDVRDGRVDAARPHALGGVPEVRAVLGSGDGHDPRSAPRGTRGRRRQSGADRR